MGMLNNIFAWRKQNTYQSAMRKQKNIAKEVRLIRATSGHEQQVHIARFEKLKKRYGF